MPEPTAQQRGGRPTLMVGAGLVVLGLSASAFLVLAARATGPEAFAGLAVLWTLVYTVGIGLFLPFEQELARAVSGRAAGGEGAGPVVRRAARAAGGLLALLTVLVLVTLPWTGQVLFAGSGAAVAGLLLACAGLAAQYVQRGTFSGSGRFGAYATQIAVEGAVRLLGTAALVVAGVSAAAPYALLLGAAPLASVVAVAGPFVPLVRRAGRPAVWRELSVNLLWLLGASLAAQGLANLGTVAVRLLGRSLDPDTAGHFMSGLTVARIPLFLFAAVQAVLLPRLTGHLARGEHRSFRRQLVTVLAATGALGLAGVVGAGLLGPEVLRLLFGPDFALPRADLAWLAVSTAVYMLALTFQPAVIALDEHRANALAWLAGLAAFVACLALPGGVLRRVELALTVGGLVTTAVLAWRTMVGAGRAAERDLRLDPATSRLGME
jgi:O-antigen/teichoic acid export membrane protein